METIADYIVAEGPHFIPLGRFPIATPSTSVNEALRLMRERKTRGVLVRAGKRRYRLLMEEQIGRSRRSTPAGDPTQVSLKQCLGVAPQARTISLSQTRGEASSAYAGDSPFRFVGVVARGEMIGLLTEAEDFEAHFFTAPTIYVCGRGHNYLPPPPRLCRIDGTPVKPA
jgi:CBS domain-containing protein